MMPAFDDFGLAGEAEELRHGRARKYRRREHRSAGPCCASADREIAGRGRLADPAFSRGDGNDVLDARQPGRPALRGLRLGAQAPRGARGAAPARAVGRQADQRIGDARQAAHGHLGRGAYAAPWRAPRSDRWRSRTSPCRRRRGSRSTGPKRSGTGRWLAASRARALAALRTGRRARRTSGTRGRGARSRAFSSEVGTGSREENAMKQRAFSSEVGTGSREENAMKQRAFSSEVGTGSREENAMKQRAFSSEVGTGSREENAIKQRAGAFPLFGGNVELEQIRAPLHHRVGPSPIPRQAGSSGFSATARRAERSCASMKALACRARSCPSDHKLRHTPSMLESFGSTTADEKDSKAIGPS